MKVKTDYVPEEVDYLTAGKVYECTKSEIPELYIIINDDGDEIAICIEESCHINYRAWQVVED